MSHDSHSQSVLADQHSMQFAGQYYRLDKTIGEGTYGKVKLAVDIRTNTKVAVKVMDKANIKSDKQIARIQREIRFLKLLSHPHIVKVYDVIETPERIFIAMEYATGGELFDYIVAHKRVREKEARQFFRQVISAVDYCHANAVIHRDLKPENLLLDAQKCIKIIDFGFGNTYVPDELLNTFCGSPFYASPEMILGTRYEGPEVDMWSLGVILFALLCGHLPFDDDNVKELYHKISHAQYVMPDHVTEPCRHLIHRMICVDPKNRATLKEIKTNDWVCEGYSGPPDSHLPLRMLASVSDINQDVVMKMAQFGYKSEESMQALAQFVKSQSVEHGMSVRKLKKVQLHPAVTTYFLICEMTVREREQRERQQEEVRRQEADLARREREAAEARKLDQLVNTAVRTQLVSPLAVQANSPLVLSGSQSSLKAASVTNLHAVDEQKSNTKARTKTSTTAYVAKEPVKDTRKTDTVVAVSPQTQQLKPKRPAPITINTMTPNGSDDKGFGHSASPSVLRQQFSPMEAKPNFISLDRPAPHSAHPTSMTPLRLPTPKVSTQISVEGGASKGSTRSILTQSSNGKRTSTQVSVTPPPRGTTNTPPSRRVPLVPEPSAQDLRNVSGWFVSVATTSSKEAVPFMMDLMAALKQLVTFGISFECDPSLTPWILTVEVNAQTFNRQMAASDLSTKLKGDKKQNTVAEEEDDTDSVGVLHLKDVHLHLQDMSDVPINFDQEMANSSSTSVSPVQTATNSSNSVQKTSTSLVKKRTDSFVTTATAESQQALVFEIEICQVPRLNLRGIVFRRIQGGLWTYKKACNKILESIKM